MAAAPWKIPRTQPDPGSLPPGRQPGIADADPRMMAGNKIPATMGAKTGRAAPAGHVETWEDIRRNVRSGQGQKYLEPGPDRDHALRLSQGKRNQDMPSSGIFTRLPGAMKDAYIETVEDVKGGAAAAGQFGQKAVVFVVLAGLAFWALGGAKLAQSAASKSVTIG